MPLSNPLLEFLCHTAHGTNQQHHATQLLFAIRIYVPAKIVKVVSLVMQNAVISKHVYDTRTLGIATGIPPVS